MSAEPHAGPGPAARAATGPEVRVEPTVALEWSQAVELPPGDPARNPAEARRAWVHRAPEKQVLALYRAASEADPKLPAPWWLHALAAGELASRKEAFSVEDRVARLLATRTGWVFVPWSAEGDPGYWEYMPSERTLAGPGTPTTLVLTQRHIGWLNVYPAHTEDTLPQPQPVHGLADLRANLARIESLR